MPVTKPYYRIYRPGLHQGEINNPIQGYDGDTLFLPEVERKSMIMAARLIINDFEQLFEYVEPHSNNVNVFSHRIYELLLRTCTEVESCCKGILAANEFIANNMNDYKKIEQATHLSSYTVRYYNWLPSEYVVQPFANWAIGGSLPWYQAYNDVKHDRSHSFQLASLKNLLDAISGLLSLIHAQIGDAVQQVFESNVYFSAVGTVDVEVRSFIIKPYQFSDNDKYDFDWESIKHAPDCFQRFQFI